MTTLSQEQVKRQWQISPNVGYDYQEQEAACPKCQAEGRAEDHFRCEPSDVPQGWEEAVSPTRQEEHGEIRWVRLICRPRVSLHRTTDGQAVLQRGTQTWMFPWTDLLSLRDLVSQIPTESARDKECPRTVKGPWAVSGSALGIALMAETHQTLHLDANEWVLLDKLLYVDDKLMAPVEVARLTGRPRQRVSEAILMGQLFAFQLPNRKTRQWLIPQRAAEEWAGGNKNSGE